MSPWPTEKHFASWLALCPGVNKTGGRSQSKNARTRPSSNRAATALRMAAFALLRSDCALGPMHGVCVPIQDRPKAITATAHKLAIIIYNMLKYGKIYVDRGAEYYDQQYRATILKNLKRRAQKLGYDLVQSGEPQAADETVSRDR